MSGKCNKVPYDENKQQTALSLSACQMFCDKDSIIWPKPTGKLDVGNLLLHVNINSIDVVASKPDSKAGKLIQEAGKVS